MTGKHAVGWKAGARPPHGLRALSWMSQSQSLAVGSKFRVELQAIDARLPGVAFEPTWIERVVEDYLGIMLVQAVAASKPDRPTPPGQAGLHRDELGRALFERSIGIRAGAEAAAQ